MYTYIINYIVRTKCERTKCKWQIFVHSGAADVDSCIRDRLELNRKCISIQGNLLLKCAVIGICEFHSKRNSFKLEYTEADIGDILQ